MTSRLHLDNAGTLILSRYLGYRFHCQLFKLKPYKQCSASSAFVLYSMNFTTFIRDMLCIARNMYGLFIKPNYIFCISNGMYCGGRLSASPRRETAGRESGFNYRSNLTFCVSLIRYSWEEKNDTIGSVFILSISIISFYHIMLNSGSFLFIDLRRAL